MPIYIGNQKIDELYYGSQKISEAYMGSQLVYQAVRDPRSWWSANDGVKHYFDINNTPIANFWSGGGSAADLTTINGISVERGIIKELVFGESYNNVPSLITNFLRYYSELTKLNMWGLSGVTGIANNCFINLFSLTEIDLSTLDKLTSVGSSIFSTQVGQSSLVKIKIGGKDWSTVSGSSGFNNRQTPTGTIYADTLQLATAFRTKFSSYLGGWSVEVG